ncbi:glycerophosphodiester phosphodiesterase [uncultured Amnibacterium sp.]|uniref:glycerophosphodiester phosphodiesterase n=1 Tax=uncultured Amnibacterium sp. TaxID=1631851 RepID=UPI0035CA90CB
MAAAETGDRADTALRALERGRSSAGDAIGRDPALARRVLEEQLPQDLAAVSVLVAAVRDGVPDRLAEDLPGQPADPVLARLADSLTTRESLAPERARWAVAVWAVALGLATAAPRTATATTAVQAAAPVRRDPSPPTAPVPPPRDDRGAVPPGRRRRRSFVPLIIAGGVVLAVIVVGGGLLVLRPTVAPASVAKPVRPSAGGSATPTPTPTPLPAIVVAAHRGGGELYPLETAEAMLDAARRPGVAVETDMRFTSDGVPVLVHDQTTPAYMPCTGGVSRPVIATKTYTWLSANCRTLASASPSGGQYTIPRVEDVARQLSAIAGAQWLLEIKTTLTPTQETRLFDILAKYKMVDRTVLTSFFAPEIAKARAESTRRGHDIRLMQFVQNTAMSGQKAANDGLWAVGVQSPAVTKDYVSALHGEGVKAVVWTPNTPAEWQRAETAGADLVITDKPTAWLTWEASDRKSAPAVAKPRAVVPRPVTSRPAVASPSASPSPSAVLTPVPTPTPSPAEG